MSYSYGCRVDNDSNAITVIDEENRTADTKGYVNGEYVEFSGGGGSSDFSTVTMTISGFPSGLGGGIGFVTACYVEDGQLFCTGGPPIALSNGTYEAVMYKGEGFAQLYEESGWAISGNATSDYTGIIYTGDFTISAV